MHTDALPIFLKIVPTMSSLIAEEVASRRTFAIISHPDAGKTTITEKLLLFGQAIQTAGSVKGKKGDKKSTSDWMAMEQQRGISVTSSCNPPFLASIKNRDYLCYSNCLGGTPPIAECGRTLL